VSRRRKLETLYAIINRGDEEEMRLFYNDIADIIAKLGGIVVILTAIITWTSTRIDEKLSYKWKHEYGKELELIKSKISSEHELYKSSLSQISSGYQFSQERRIKAIEVMWEYIVKLREFISPLHTFYSVLLPDEYDNVILKNTNTFGLENISDESINKVLSEMNEKINLQRPFLGENLWGLFFTYRAFICRSAFLFLKGRENHIIQPWYIDKGLINFLKISLGDQEFS
jgi:hypothetical protein